LIGLVERRVSNQQRRTRTKQGRDPSRSRVPVSDDRCSHIKKLHRSSPWPASACHAAHNVRYLSSYRHLLHTQGLSHIRPLCCVIT